MNPRRIAQHLLVIIAATLLLAPGTVWAHESDRGPSLETPYYNGTEYRGFIPSQYSANPNQDMLGCIPLGPRMSSRPAGPTTNFYVALLPGATDHACADGSLLHDHVIAAVPGVPGYSPHWRILLVVPGPSFDPAIMPLTSEQAVLAAAAAGQVAIVDTGLVFVAPIVGGGH